MISILRERQKQYGQLKSIRWDWCEFYLEFDFRWNQIDENYLFYFSFISIIVLLCLKITNILQSKDSTSKLILWSENRHHQHFHKRNENRLFFEDYYGQNLSQKITHRLWVNQNICRKKNPIQIAQNEEQYCGEGGWESQSKKLPIQNSKFKANKEGEVFIEIEF